MPLEKEPEQNYWGDCEIDDNRCKKTRHPPMHEELSIWTVISLQESNQALREQLASNGSDYQQLDYTCKRSDPAPATAGFWEANVKN